MPKKFNAQCKNMSVLQYVSAQSLKPVCVRAQLRGNTGHYIQ